jgi:RecB family exonuclease
VNQRLIVAFCVDLNLTQRATLSAVQDWVTILVAAPERLSSKFDPLGCLDYAYWSTCDLDVHSDQLHLAVSAEDQGARTVELLARYGDGLASSQLAVTAADPELVPLIHERLAELGMGLQWTAGSPALRSAPALLCEALADCLEKNGFADWARLARHPHLSRITGESSDGGDYLEHFDQCYAQHLPVGLDLETLDSIEAGFADVDLPSKRKSAFGYLPALRSWLRQVKTWLAPLLERAKPRSLWHEPLRQVFSAVYPEIAQADSIVNPVYRLLSESIDRITDIPSRFDGPVTAPRMLRGLLDALRQRSIPAAEIKEGIAGIGWLETPWDDRPVLVVTGMSEGVVPQLVGSDPFIPRGLRKRLRLEDNERRHARDAYALQLTLHSGRQVHFVVGRVDSGGRPLAPSRLLAARPAREVPDRVLQLYQDDGDDFLIRPVALASAESPTPARSASEGPKEESVDDMQSLEIPRPRTGATVERMSVTSFGDYLRCPYRFYLRHVLGLHPCNDAAEELDPRQFGNLIHDVLEVFGKDPVAGSKNSSEIEEFFHAEVDRWVQRHFGSHLNATVSFQIQQARARFAAVAVKQAERTKEGWCIKFVELDIPPGKVTVPNDPMPLIGRIDRVDYNAEEDRWAILDYKTGSRGKRPKAAHLQGGRWLSLQLPLYRHMVPEVNPERCDLGYFLIPPKAGDTGVYCDSFSLTELDAADKEATRVATAVRNCEFWPPTEPYEGIDDFAAICQSRSGTRRRA